MKDMSRDGNQIFVGEFELDGVTSVITVVNGKCITFDKGVLDVSVQRDVDELVNTAANMGLNTDESRLVYPMLYGVKNTFVYLFPSPYAGDDLKCVSVGQIDALPNGFNEKVRCLIDGYATV